MEYRLVGAGVELVAGTREWIAAAVESPRPLAAHVGASLAPDWDEDDYGNDARYVVADMKLGEEGWWYWWILATDQRNPATLVGFVGFKGPPTRGGNVELMYGLSPSARGRGLASSSVRLLLDWAFKHPPVNRVVATIDPDNVASCRVVERCGLELLDEECDGAELVYQITRNRRSAGSLAPHGRGGAR